MIIDTFTFFNELELLEGRLEYLYDTVDWFVIVETDYTHSGDPKPLNYLANIKRYQRFADKILYWPFAADVTGLDFNYRPTAMDGNSAHWQLENTQRNHIRSALQLFPADATVIISDLDEIPSKSAISTAENILGTVAEAFSLDQILYYYNFDYHMPLLWTASVVTTNRFAQGMTPQALRFMGLSGNMPRIFNGGWHLSYWGGAERVSYKIQKFAHQELNHPEYTDVDAIRRRMSTGQDPYDRGQMVTTDINSIPQDIRDIFSKYSVSHS